MPYADIYIHKYKFWWNQELDLLKEKAVSSNKVWKVAGKPHSGPIFQERKSDKFAYKIKIRESKEMSSSAIEIVYTRHYLKKVVNSGMLESKILQ